MNNTERDEMLSEIREKVEDTHTAVTRLEGMAHNPLACPAMAEHKDSHGRHIKWFFMTLGAIITGLTFVVLLIKSMS